MAARKKPAAKEVQRVCLVGRPEPFRALRMSPDPITLGPGEFQLSQNLRCDNGLPIVRDGIDRVVDLDNSAFASKTMRGYWEGYMGGSYRRIAAISIAGPATAIYDLLTGAEITADGVNDQWGLTRFTDGTSVHFTVVADQLNNTTKLVAANGVDAPRVIYNTGTTNWICAIHSDITAPSGIEGVAVKMTSNHQNFAIRNATPITVTDNGGGIAGANDNTRYHPFTAAAGNAVKMHFTTATASGEYATIVTSTGVSDMTRSRQVWVGIESDRFDFIDTWQVSLLNGGGSELILWDPSTAASYPRPIPVTIDATNKIIWCFPLSAQNTGTYDQLRFKYKRSYVPTVAGDFWVFMIAFGGSEPGQTLYGLTQYNPYSQAESPGVVYSNYDTESLFDAGAPSMNGLLIPNVPEMLYDVKFQLVNPSSAEINLGTSTHRVYSQLYGQNQFYLTGSHIHSTWAPSTWTTSGAVFNFTTNPPLHTSQVSIVMPDAFHKCIPTAAIAPCFSSNRLFAGAYSNATDARYDTLWVSTFGNPYRFRKSPRLSNNQPVEESAFTVNIPGETIKRIITTSTGGLTGSATCVLTDSSVYGTSGSKLSSLASIRRISPYGLASEFAVAEDDGAIAWFSTTGGIMFCQYGQTTELSWRSIEDQLTSVTLSATEYPAVSSIAFANNCLYCARRTTSAYQTQADRVLVYDFRYKAWVSDDVLPTETPCFVLCKGEGGVKELVLTIVGRYGQKIKVYEYDSPGLVGDEQDAGVQDIAWALKTRDLLVDPDAGRFTIGRVGVLCTADASTIAVQRSFRPDGITGASTIDIASTATEAFGIDAATGITSTPTDTALWGSANAVKLSGSHPARFQIFHAHAELEARGDGAKTIQVDA